MKGNFKFIQRLCHIGTHARKIVIKQFFTQIKLKIRTDTLFRSSYSAVEIFRQ